MYPYEVDFVDEVRMRLENGKRKRTWLNNHIDDLTGLNNCPVVAGLPTPQPSDSESDDSDLPIRKRICRYNCELAKVSQLQFLLLLILIIIFSFFFSFFFLILMMIDDILF